MFVTVAWLHPTRTVVNYLITVKFGDDNDKIWILYCKQSCIPNCSEVGCWEVHPNSITNFQSRQESKLNKTQRKDYCGIDIHSTSPKKNVGKWVNF